MKKILFLFFVVMALASCSSSSDDEPTPKQMNTPEGTIADKLGLNLDDFSYYSASTFDNNDYFAGIKKSNNTFMVGVYDNSKAKGTTYQDDDTFPQQITVNQDYGETSTLDLTNFYIGQAVSNGNVIIFNPYAIYGYGQLIKVVQKLVRYNGSSIKTAPKSYTSGNIWIYNWYNNSFAVIEQYHNVTIYSQDLDIITSYTRDNQLDTLAEYPVAYDESIILPTTDLEASTKTISRYNYTKQTALWQSINLNEKYSLEEDARLTFTLNSKTNNIWDWNLHVVNRDGSTKDITFTLNIDTGDIN